MPMSSSIESEGWLVLQSETHICTSVNVTATEPYSLMTPTMLESSENLLTK